MADEWAEAERYVAMGAEKGPYRVSRTPYVREILRVASGVKYRRVALICATQMAKTQGVFLNVIGHRLTDDPVPTLIAFPTRSAAEGQFEPKLTSMLRNCPALWAKTAQGKENRKTHKKVAGMDVRIVWTGSAAEMASQEAGIVALDELDRMDDVPGEGDPIEVAEGRGRTFPDFLMLLAATPTLGTVDTYTDEHGMERWRVAEPGDVASRIWRAWQEGTRHEYAWPCPECGRYFVPRFKRLWWPEDAASLRAIRREARVRCTHCQALIDERAKLDCNARGLHVAPGQFVVEGVVEGEPPDSECWSTWVSGLCSPWHRLGDIAASYVQAVRSGNPGTLQAVKNLRCGELYSLAGQALPWQEVKRKLLASYRMGEVPDGVQLLVAGVDVQGDRLVYEVRGWGVRMHSWLIETGELYGDPNAPQVWRDLESVRCKSYADGLRVCLMLVDSGYFPAPVYAFVGAHSEDEVRVTKGASHDLQGRPYKRSATAVSARRGKPLPMGMGLWSINTVFHKDIIWAKLASDDPAIAGGFALPVDVPDRYVLELTGETRVPVAKGGSVYQKLRANHAFDTAVLTLVAGFMRGVDRLIDPRPPQVVARPDGAPMATASIGDGRPIRFRFGG